MSCQKEYDPGIVEPPVIDPPSSIGDSIYLDKIWNVLQDGSGDTLIGILHYDNLKRVVSITDSVAGSPGTATDFLFFYNGTDTIPFKSVEYEFGASTTIPDTTTSFFFYDAQARKIRDSSIVAGVTGTRFLKVINFTYATGKIFGERRFEYLTSPDPTEYMRDTAVLDAKGNIISNKEYKLTGANYILNITSVFTYDDKPSPFSNLSIIKAFQQFPNGETLLTEYAGHNNITSQDEIVINPANHFTTSFNYVYSPTGFPILQTGLFAGFNEKYQYTYRSL